MPGTHMLPGMGLEDLLGNLGPLQEGLAEAERKQATATIEGTAGGGAVRIRLGGDLSVRGVTIAPAAAAASSDDVGMLEDLIAAALSDALRNHQQRFGGSTSERMSKLMGDSGLGSLLGPLLGGMGR